MWLAKRHLSWVQCLVFCIGAKRNISCFESELTDSWPIRRQEGWDCPPIGLRIFCHCRENILLHLSLSWKYFVAFVFAVKLLLRDFCRWLPTDWLITRQVLTRISKFVISRKISKIFWCRLYKIFKAFIPNSPHWSIESILDSHWSDCQRNMYFYALIGQTGTFLILIGHNVRGICNPESSLARLGHSWFSLVSLGWPSLQVERGNVVFTNLFIPETSLPSDPTLICKDDNSFQKPKYLLHLYMITVVFFLVGFS